MRRNNATLSIATLVMSLLLAACGGGDATVGGTVTGLPTGASVTLQNNATDNLTVSSNTSFTFSKALQKDKAYSVTVLTQPAGATCVVTNGSGTINSEGADVANVTVTCTASASSLTGTVTGLLPGSAVRLVNAGVTLDVSVDGAFAFPGTIANNATYNVTIATQPQGARVCAVTNGSGTFVTGTPTAIVVTCS